MSIPLFQVDAFTGKAFGGNPAAVCLLSHPAEASWMQAVAREMNLSETAFLEPAPDGWNLRWFTPVLEVKLCGHATLASAHVLWETGRLPADQPARFHTLSGWLRATRTGTDIEMDFPVQPVQPGDAPDGLAQALGATLGFVGHSESDYLVEVACAETVRSLAPDYGQLRALPIRGVIVTARSDQPEFDFISRFFAPGVGVDEDPVTGSAHCSLAPFWAERTGKTEFTAWQASARGGRVKARLSGARVLLSGQAVTVMRGEFLG